MKGRAVIAAGHEQLFNTIYRDSVNTIEVENVRFIRPDVALMHTHNTLRPAGNRLPPEMHARSSLVLAKENDEWQIVGFQNTPIIPPRPDFPDAAEVARQVTDA
jgi:uncharacterized protein (TIGR02246 family)